MTHTDIVKLIRSRKYSGTTPYENSLNNGLDIAIEILEDEYLLPKTLQDEVAEWSRTNFGDNIKNPPYLALFGVVEELGELAHTVVKSTQGIRTTENHREKQKDAIGDIVIFLLDYCSRENLDLVTIVKDIWEKVRQRDWIENPEGKFEED